VGPNVFSFDRQSTDQHAMSSEPFRINYVGLFVGTVGVVVGLMGMLAMLVTQKFVLGFPLILCGFTVFVTAMMMCAKTTGGAQE
jgi:hypothetical protein